MLREPSQAELDTLFTQISRGGAANSALELISEALDKLDLSVDTKIYDLLASGALDPQVAVQAWAEKHAYNRLRSRLGRVARVGASAARKITPNL